MITSYPSASLTVAPTSDEAAVRARLDEIWTAAHSRDFERLESFHRYDAGFTEFKECRPRGDAHSCAAGERAIFSALESPEVDMGNLAIRIHGSVAIVTFDGDFRATLHGDRIALMQQCTMILVQDEAGWRVVHEHMSPLDPAPTRS